MRTNPLFNNPQAIVDLGERIYSEKLKDQLEATHAGKFVAIDVVSGEAAIADYSGEAMQKAMAEHPGGVFYLMRIGAPAAFEFAGAHAKPAWLS